MVERNRYGDVLIRVSCTEDLARIDEILKDPALSLAVVWAIVDADHTELIGPLRASGFCAHSVAPNSFTFVRGTGSEPLPPPLGTHILRVEVIVRDSNGNVLVVKERRGPRDWKLPSGNVEPNERMVDAVMREIKEETGLNVAFEGVLGFGHRPHDRYGKNEIYVVCGVRCIGDPRMAHVCDGELAELKWISHAQATETWKDCFQLRHLQLHCLLSTPLLNRRIGNFDIFFQATAAPRPPFPTFYSTYSTFATDGTHTRFRSRAHRSDEQNED